MNSSIQLHPTSSSEKVQPLTTGPCDHCAEYLSKLIELKYFSLLFTLFEPYGAVFIMNSKIHLRKNSSDEHFKTISHYFRVYLLSGFARSSGHRSFAVKTSTARISSHLSNWALLCLQPAVICLRNTLRFANVQ